MMEDLYGHMSYRFVNGAVYDGEWNKGKKHGKGVFSYPDGSKYDGIYSQNYIAFFFTAGLPLRQLYVYVFHFMHKQTS